MPAAWVVLAGEAPPSPRGTAHAPALPSADTHGSSGTRRRGTGPNCGAGRAAGAGQSVRRLDTAGTVDCQVTAAASRHENRGMNQGIPAQLVFELYSKLTLLRSRRAQESSQQPSEQLREGGRRSAWGAERRGAPGAAAGLVQSSLMPAASARRRVFRPGVWAAWPDPRWDHGLREAPSCCPGGGRGPVPRCIDWRRRKPRARTAPCARPLADHLRERA